MYVVGVLCCLWACMVRSERFQDGWELVNVNSDDYFSVQSILAHDLQHVPDSGALRIWGRTRREGGEYEYATYAAVRPGAVLPTATWHSPPPKVRRGKSEDDGARVPTPGQKWGVLGAILWVGWSALFAMNPVVLGGSVFLIGVGMQYGMPRFIAYVQRVTTLLVAMSSVVLGICMLVIEMGVRLSGEDVLEEPVYMYVVERVAGGLILSGLVSLAYPYLSVIWASQRGQARPISSGGTTGAECRSVDKHDQSGDSDRIGVAGEKDDERKEQGEVITTQEAGMVREMVQLNAVVGELRGAIAQMYPLILKNDLEVRAALSRLSMERIEERSKPDPVVRKEVREIPLESNAARCEVVEHHGETAVYHVGTERSAMDGGGSWELSQEGLQAVMREAVSCWQWEGGMPEQEREEQAFPVVLWEDLKLGPEDLVGVDVVEVKKRIQQVEQGRRAEARQPVFLSAQAWGQIRTLGDLYAACRAAHPRFERQRREDSLPCPEGLESRSVDELLSYLREQRELRWEVDAARRGIKLEWCDTCQKRRANTHLCLQTPEGMPMLKKGFPIRRKTVISTTIIG